MRTSLNSKTVRSSSNSTPRVGFGRFPWMTDQNCSQPLSHHLDVFDLIDYHLVSAPPQRSSNALCHMDDVLIHGADQSEHDGRVRAEAGLTLNEKCEFSRSSIRFLAHIIDSFRIHAESRTLLWPNSQSLQMSPGYSDSWGW